MPPRDTRLARHDDTNADTSLRCVGAQPDGSCFDAVVLRQETLGRQVFAVGVAVLMAGVLVAIFAPVIADTNGPGWQVAQITGVGVTSGALAHRYLAAYFILWDRWSSRRGRRRRYSTASRRERLDLELRVICPFIGLLVGFVTGAIIVW